MIGQVRPVIIIDVECLCYCLFRRYAPWLSKNRSVYPLFSLCFFIKVFLVENLEDYNKNILPIDLIDCKNTYWENLAFLFDLYIQALHLTHLRVLPDLGC